ncbi:S-layer homology domain-containing protein [Aneurinibacillus sp. Ricciae_BoGa-3]|uniref:S-layer homology domain-containing protein n=1 Tax=Aneurinibacillus sp. Ricciae_BoGa-3 TaxID=3022697 RepID=UPI0023416E25|nr:S-layer homology domain-containing protein [Aneurinibacillus sp. Ricciae_BoGa-3]WCK52461.1 S-layer homology domain-containing protein [Aneurinibacillus sp. Ricciae_BoGa-3]
MKFKVIKVALASAIALSTTSAVSAASLLDNNLPWAKDSIDKMMALGAVTGYEDHTFKPDNQITRAEFVTIVNKAYNKFDQKAVANFSDVHANQWFYSQVASAKSAGYIAGYPDNTFAPDQPITRAEAAVMVAKLLNLDTSSTAGKKFTDESDLPQWALNSITALAQKQVLNGYTEDGTFRPNQDITRAEAVVMLDKGLSVNGDTTPAPASQDTVGQGIGQAVDTNASAITPTPDTVTVDPSQTGTTGTPAQPDAASQTSSQPGAVADPSLNKDPVGSAATPPVADTAGAGAQQTQTASQPPKPVLSSPGTNPSGDPITTGGQSYDVQPVVSTSDNSGSVAPASSRPTAVFNGTFMFIWNAKNLDNGDVNAMIAQAKKLGVTGVIIKFANGSLKGDPVSQGYMAQFKKYAAPFKAAGFQVGGWIYQYLTDVPGEVDACSQAIQAGADFIVLDAEVELKGKGAQVAEFGQLLRSKYPDTLLALSSFAIADYHPEVPFAQYNNFVNAMMPQIYWDDMGWTVDKAFKASIASYQKFGKPIAPTGQSYSTAQPEDIARFVQLSQAAKFTNISWWDWEEANQGQLGAIQNNLLTVPPNA